MDKHEEYQRKVAESMKRDRMLRELEEDDEPYDPIKLSIHMPLGCWLWIIGLIALAIYLLRAASKHF